MQIAVICKDQDSVCKLQPAYRVYYFYFFYIYTTQVDDDDGYERVYETAERERESEHKRESIPRTYLLYMPSQAY